MGDADGNAPSVRVPEDELVPIRKWSFWPISASICAFACAATCRSPPHKRLISLISARPRPAPKGGPGTGRAYIKILISGLETGF